jgi:hypothetical protein
MRVKKEVQSMTRTGRVLPEKANVRSMSMTGHLGVKYMLCNFGLDYAYIVPIASIYNSRVSEYHTAGTNERTVGIAEA